MTSRGTVDRLMRRYVLETKQVIHPFELPAAKLPVLNKTIFEHQEDVFTNLKIKEKPSFISSLEEVILSTSQTLVYRDNIYFNKELVLEFLNKASAIGKPARLAFLDTDPCFSVHNCYPQHNMEHVGDLYMGDFFFFPAGEQEKDLISIKKDFVSVIIDTESRPLSCFSMPSLELGLGQRISNNFPLAEVPPMQLQVPRLSYIAIKHWTQLLFANFTWGIYCQIRQLSIEIQNQNMVLRKILSYISKRRGPIHIGRDCQIDPTATIIGPTTIGDGVVIGPNVTIAAGYIGDHAVLEPSCTVWFGVVGARSSLLANRNIVMSCVMNNSIINTDIRFSIVGSNSFLGAGSHITDCVLKNVEGDPRISAPMVKVISGKEIINSGYYILGPAIGNRVKIGSGVIIYPGRVIKSGSLILPNQGHNIIDR
jgi:acetyltransferase-like isoleucine patch superfamily enzyme